MIEWSLVWEDFKVALPIICVLGLVWYRVRNGPGDPDE